MQHRCRTLDHLHGRILEGHHAKNYKLDPVICPSTRSNIFHAIAGVEEAGRDEEALREALSQLMSGFGHQNDLINTYAYHAPDSSSRHSTTPLIDAVRQSNITVVKALLDAGADPCKSRTDGF
jgi:hypothetical protein